MGRGSTTDEERLSRPLPSVGIPLLKEERRAANGRRVLGVAAVVLVATAAFGAAVVVQRAEGKTGLSTVPAEATPSALEPTVTTSAAPAPTSDEPFVPAGAAHAAILPPLTTTDDASDGATRTTRRFGRARGFRDAIGNAGASADETAEIERALTGVLDFRHCRPEDELVFLREPTGGLRSFEYHGSPVEYYRAYRTTSGELVGERVEIPVERTRLSKGGIIQTSLGNALTAAGLGPSLVGRFVEAFEGHVDFAVHTRGGDQFRLLVDEERIDGAFHRYGTVHAIEYVGVRDGRLRAFWFEPVPGRGDFFDPEGRSLHGGWLRSPLRYERISSRFNLRRRHPILRRIVPHTGVDYAAGSGTPVWAAADGTVTFAGERGANGNLVVIRHADGYETSYAHLLRIERAARRGATVHQRQVIGYVGSTGRSTGPHLHFGLKRHGQFVDPLPVINGPGQMMAASALPAYRRVVRRLTAALETIPIEASVPVDGSRAEADSAAGVDDEPMDY
jgi:murein DD-endopeptidase MepM/ murein hydrolase activator NlpD